MGDNGEDGSYIDPVEFDEIVNSFTEFEPDWFYIERMRRITEEENLLRLAEEAGDEVRAQIVDRRQRRADTHSE